MVGLIWVYARPTIEEDEGIIKEYQQREGTNTRCIILINQQLRVPRTETLCDVTQYPMAISTPSIIVIHISSSSLCFVNAKLVREGILKWVIEDDDLKATILD
ncbi:hypothetical protein TanjilG_30863 [Lupinus angustifolius]|uniref:Uncharacterized protein n=1 Tax=Lupinus angustifolius TaxID=3871 RepID=A0A1J7H9N7_LUPAN|nr:hypothetical protein TanjilG_30863 [Lupinus angustifolius]